MKFLAYTVATMAMCASVGAFAAAPVFCNGKKLLSQTELGDAVKGKYTCGTYNGERWNELHAGGLTGTITDYKLGPTNPTDPSKQVGTYAITADGDGGVLTDSYTGG